MQKTIVFGVEQLDAIAKQLLAYSERVQAYALEGSLGAGKTSLVASMLRQSGVIEAVVSPTFTYVHVYQTHTGVTLYHFDLYRMKSLAEFQAAGFDEYLYAPNSISFIEWPTPIKPLLTCNVCWISLEYTDDQRRELTYTIQE